MNNILDLYYLYKGSQNNTIRIEIKNNTIIFYSSYNEKMFEGNMDDGIHFLHDLINDEYC